MKLKEEKIDNLARKILSALSSNVNIKLNAPEDKVLHEIKNVFLKDFKREDELDEEIHKKLKDNIDKLQKVNVNYSEIFRKAKIQIAKEKKIVL